MVGLLRLPRRAPIQKTKAGRSIGIHSGARLLFGPVHPAWVRKSNTSLRRGPNRAGCPAILPVISACSCLFHWLTRSEEHTSELQSLRHLVCRLLLEKKKRNTYSPVMRLEA